LNSKDYFENYFKHQKKLNYSKSLLNFYEEIVSLKINSKQALKILDIGSGHYSIFEDVKDLNADMTAMDFSQTAIAQSPKSKIKYLLGDISETKFFKDKLNYYSLIFDSHCLNCITSPRDRQVAFQNIYFALKPEGIFATELMVQPIGQNVVMPFKMIKTANELEAEIISYGFKINYFMISKENSFGTLVNGVEVTCDVLRVIAKK
jgi:SAM-dependent methyltransferase